jgi:hypothetical protein
MDYEKVRKKFIENLSLTLIDMVVRNCPSDQYSLYFINNEIEYYPI